MMIKKLLIYITYTKKEGVMFEINIFYLFYSYLEKITIKINMNF